jgi:hypothetical protein
MQRCYVMLVASSYRLRFTESIDDCLLSHFDDRSEEIIKDSTLLIEYLDGTYKERAIMGNMLSSREGNSQVSTTVTPMAARSCQPKWNASSKTAQLPGIYRSIGRQNDND